MPKRKRRIETYCYNKAELEKKVKEFAGYKLEHLLIRDLIIEYVTDGGKGINEILNDVVLYYHKVIKDLEKKALNLLKIKKNNSGKIKKLKKIGDLILKNNLKELEKIIL